MKDYNHNISIVNNEYGKMFKIKTTHHLTVCHYITETELNMSINPFILIEEVMKYNEEQLLKKEIELVYESDDISLDDNIKDSKDREFEV